ncbi:MAG: site-2 protease family protein [Thermomicrobiales bacterium]
MFGDRAFDFSPEFFAATVIAFVLAITIHEFMHAWSAFQLGDTTAASLGRITLNPAAHFDPLGFIFMILLALGIGFIAWGKPVPINPNRLRYGKLGYGLTALAGPASNLVLAAVMILPLRLTGVELTGFAGLLASQIIFLNLLLAAFNMVPIPPLDGSKILAGILPDFWFQPLARLDQYGFGILLVIILLGGFTGGSLLFDMYRPVLDLFWTVIVGATDLTGYRV